MDFESLGQSAARTYAQAFFLITVNSSSGTSQENIHVLFFLLVLDVNDNSPVFSENTPLYRTVLNSTRVGKEVMKVEATDADHSKNGLVTFTLEATLKHSPSNAFRINGQTGQVYVNTPLASDNMGQRYDIRIIAEDHGKPAKYTSTVVTLFVQQRGTFKLKSSTKSGLIRTWLWFEFASFLYFVGR